MFYIYIYIYIYRHLHVNILVYLFSSLTAKPSYLPPHPPPPPQKKKKNQLKLINQFILVAVTNMNVLTWNQRLHIAVDASHGLEKINQMIISLSLISIFLFAS